MGVARLGLLVLIATAVLVASAPTHLAHASAVFVVNSEFDADDGLCDATHCSLREAIGAANATPGADTIDFNIPPGGTRTIYVNISGLGLLPAITDTVDIDGTTQPGYAGQPIIELSGMVAGAAGVGLQFNMGSDNSTVRGLVINNFTKYGIAGAHNVGSFTFDGNYIGTNAAGTGAAANGTGICLCGSFGSTIGGPLGNLISGNTYGVEPSEQGGANVIIHNLIGTDATGTSAIPNVVGVYIFESSSNTIGGSTPAERNVISGNGTGVSVERNPLGGVLVSGNVISGNYVGTDVAGTAAIGNGTGVAILARGGGQRIGGSTNLTAGACTGSCNLISGNAVGVSIGNLGNALVTSNFIGTSISGLNALANTFTGVSVDAVPTQGSGPTTVGGNLISGNGGDGVIANGPGTRIVANKIGTDSTGGSPLGNAGRGVYVTGSQTIVGDTFSSSGGANVIAFNGSHGVEVDGASAIQNPAFHNSIFQNGGKGIENVNGGNAELPQPLITGLSPLSGTIPSGPCAFGTICYIAVYSDTVDEGMTFEGMTSVGAGGAWTYSGTTAGPCITVLAMAADSFNTSEFSAPVQPAPGTPNNDGNFIDNSPPYTPAVDDLTLANSDISGDACDLDDDNDGLPDASETAGPPCASATAATEPPKLDTDGDRSTDGAECAMGSDPAVNASRPAIPPPANDPDTDRLSTAFETLIGTNPNNSDTDGDGVPDGVEYKGYGSNPLVVDTDSDAIRDRCEVASLNADTIVNSGDQTALATEIMRNVALTGIPKLANFDLNKDTVLNSGDQALLATAIGPGKCP